MRVQIPFEKFLVARDESPRLHHSLAIYSETLCFFALPLRLLIVGVRPDGCTRLAHSLVDHLAAFATTVGQSFRFLRLVEARGSIQTSVDSSLMTSSR